MSGIKHECKRAIGLINKLIKLYKPIDGDSLVYIQYRELMQDKINEIRDVLDFIKTLSSNAICDDDYVVCGINFVDFDGFDEYLYRHCFKTQLVELKEKIKLLVKAI